MSDEKRKHELKMRIALMEKEILHLTGDERAKVRNKYNKLLKSYSKECGLEEPIYLTRT